ncbi:MAG: hypothetical protein IBX69_06800 [Anaerolineales bacterium]|nr:hypothetical protein [Anaerolineales bacterium]
MHKAEPLGIPPQMVADPGDIGRKLAGKIKSRKEVIIANFKSAACLFMIRLFPSGMEKFLGAATK